MCKKQTEQLENSLNILTTKVCHLLYNIELYILLFVNVFLFCNKPFPWQQLKKENSSLMKN